MTNVSLLIDYIIHFHGVFQFSWGLLILLWRLQYNDVLGNYR